MAKFNAEFWVASATAAPVIALAAVVQFSDASKAVQRSALRELEYAPGSAGASNLAMTAFFLEYVNLFIQGFAFFVSLLVLATGVLNFSFGSLVTVAALETFGIFILLFGVSSTSVSLKMTSEPYIQRGIADLSAATSDVVLTTANRLHEANPAKQQFTLKEIVQALEPVPRDVVLARLALGLSVEELLSNTLLQLGRDGNLTVDLVPDSRGCAHLVVGFSSSMPDPLDANYRRARRPDDLGS